ncbi:MAG: hypothetical protein GEV09_14485 [Pseudonocardiaceae bacterium]|nr:hypothetical protein [Pseudonocardiaceae bacterium]
MSLDSRTPVLVGGGQVNQRDGRREPVDLLVAAARDAEKESGGSGLLAALDSIRIVHMLSWRYRDPGALVGERVGASPRQTAYTSVGGNVPQALVNQAARDIADGQVDTVLIGGAEAWRTRMRQRASGEQPSWTIQDEAVAPGQVVGTDVALLGEDERRIGLDRPSSVYPLFEQAHRIAAGRSIDEQAARSAALWSRFSAVAAGNPHAWSQREYSAAEIATPSPSNRWIAWPYPKLMNSNNMVDQGAALLLCSVAAARRYGVASDRWVFPHAGTEAQDTRALAERPGLDRSPAIRVAGRRALELADTDLDALDLVDLYSCFPSAVQVAAAELGLAIDDPARPLTQTGGLTFAGGPWSNYVSHSIATMASALRSSPGSTGLVTANGGYLTKHVMGVYGTEPPAAGFRWQDVQSEVDQEPRTVALSEWDGTGTVESWTVAHDRDGVPEAAFLAVRTPEGARTLATSRDADQLSAMLTRDVAGAAVRITADGDARLLDT